MMRRRNCLSSLIFLLAVAVSLTGCKREWYRAEADQEAQCLIDEKTYSRWSTPFRGVEMDPRSRFYDPYDPVRPPMPTDDPDSHQFMQCVDGKRGWSHWYDNGEVSNLENPSWADDLPSYVRLNSDGKLQLTLSESMRLALIHSPAYQQQLETIYLSALDVSTERFRFQTQFFGGIGGGSGGRTFFNESAIGATNIHRNGITTHTTDVSVDTDIRLRKRFATAGELIVGFANSFVWQFSGQDQNFALSIFNFSLVQPLLRGAGRQIALEQLTIAERTLLANLRAMEAYRQGFYTLVAIGENNTQGPSRRGGFSGGSGLSGFTGQGAGGFGAVGDATGFGRNAGGNNNNGGGGNGGATGFAGGGAGQVGGFIGLLQVRQQIRNTETSLRQQLQTLDLLEAHLEAGLIDIAQVDQFRQSIETERANLLQSRNALQNQLDTFKSTTLGLPPDLPVELDDSYIRSFQFLDPQVQELQASLQTIVDDFGKLEDAPPPAALREIMARLGTLRTRVDAEFTPVAADIVKMTEVRPNRSKYMEPSEQKLFDRDQQQLTDNLGALKERFAALTIKLKELEEQLTDQTAKTTATAIIGVNVEMSNIISELSLVQARARVELITLESFDLTPENALDIARANRFDWMNNRAALVDTWRLIEFNGNRLESNLDVFIDGNIGTVGDNPVRFGTDNSSIRAGVRFDAPFNRLTERNDFRQQLLVYQQSRRQMIQYEDTVHRTMRQLLRDLDQLRVNLEIQRRAVAIAIRRADQTRENLNKPTAPAQPGQPVTQFGPTAATNLLTALSDLRSSQNNFMSVWLAYQAGRMRLLRELGIMQINEDGDWIEMPLEAVTRSSASEMPVPPSVPRRWFDALDKLDGAGIDGSKGSESLPLKPADNLLPPGQIQPPQIPAPGTSSRVVPKMLPAMTAAPIPNATTPAVVAPQPRQVQQAQSVQPVPTTASGWRATKKKPE